MRKNKCMVVVPALRKESFIRGPMKNIFGDNYVLLGSYANLNSITITEIPKTRVFADFCRPIEPIFEPLSGHLCTNQV